MGPGDGCAAGICGGAVCPLGGAACFCARDAAVIPSASANNSSVGVGPPAGGGTGPPPDVASATLRSVGVSRRATRAWASTRALQQSQRPAGRRDRQQPVPVPRRRRWSRRMPPRARRQPLRPQSPRPDQQFQPREQLRSLSRRTRQEQRRLPRPARENSTTRRAPNEQQGRGSRSGPAPRALPGVLPDRAGSPHRTRCKQEESGHPSRSPGHDRVQPPTLGRR